METQNISAFPIVNPSSGLYEGYGLSKRELFAAMAMQGILSSGNNEEETSFLNTAIAQVNKSSH